MTDTLDWERLDSLVDVAGAAAPAMAAVFATAKLSPASGWTLAIAAIAAGAGALGAGLVAMRSASAGPRLFTLPDFEIAAVVDDVLLLDQPVAGELLDCAFVDSAAEAVAELLLDDALPAPAPESRVVQLFAVDRLPTPGQLKDRIDCHLAGGGREAKAPNPDEADSLSEALAELRRSLRQA